MGRPKKDASKSAGGDQTESAPEKAVKLPPEKVLKNLIGLARKAKQDTAEMNGELGASIKGAVDKHNLHKKAFSVVRGADSMEPEKLADFLLHLDDYLEKSGLRERAGKVMRMDFNEEDDDPSARTSNIKPFPQPRGEAAE